jgi:hypothetical protein
MAELALRFWTRVIEDQRVSREFATTIRAAREIVANLRHRFASQSSS